jgi:hypothetical protein
MNLPSAKNALPLFGEPVPVVSVVGGRIHCDGEVVGDAEAIAKGRRLQRVDGLWESLKGARERWKSANLGKPFHGMALFAFDKSTPAVVVKSVFQTAAFAGFPNAQFAVRGNDGTVMRLNVDAIVPGPPGANAPEPGARLLVVVRPSKHVLVWRKDGVVVSTTDGAIRDLPDRVQKEWVAHAAHRESTDKAFDQAILYVGEGVDYSGVVAVIDAIQGTTRDILLAGSKERVPAINVNLGMATEIGNTGDGDPLSTRGRIPPETIQRIVRESSARFRSCYEHGLAKNTSLAGTVRVRFVIDRSGQVAEVGDAGESNLPDPETIKCIMHEFGKLSFPRPEGGIVTVVYPLAFRADDSAPTEEPQGGGIGLGRR